MELTLTMIVKDEAAHLGHCLDSVQGLVDEIVVVDTGSTDGTPGLARARGARVVHRAWTGDFAEARNAALAEAHGDWALFLDADEAIDPADHGAFRAACRREGALAYRVLIRNYLPDGAYTMMDLEARANPGGYREGAAFAHCADTRAVRLFRRLPWVRFSHRIHEMVDPCFLDRGHALEDLDAVIHHYGFTLAPRAQAKKPLYLDLARRDAQDHPGDLQRLFHLVMQACAAEAWEEADAAAGAYRAEVRRQGRGLAPTAVLAQAQALQRLGRHGEALEVFAELDRLAPGSFPAAQGRGVSLARLGRREEAERVLEGCLREKPDFVTPYLDLADLHAASGEPLRAREVLLRGLEACPVDPGLWGRLVRLDLDGGDVPRAVQDAWEALQRCPAGGGGAWHKLVAVFLLREGAVEEGRQVLALGLQAFPGDADLARLMEAR